MFEIFLSYIKSYCTSMHIIWCSFQMIFHRCFEVQGWAYIMCVIKVHAHNQKSSRTKIIVKFFHRYLLNSVSQKVKLFLAKEFGQIMIYQVLIHFIIFAKNKWIKQLKNTQIDYNSYFSISLYFSWQESNTERREIIFFNWCCLFNWNTENTNF